MATKTVYHIAPNFRKVTFWKGHKRTGQRISVREVKPLPGLTKKEREEIILAAIKEEGLQPPKF